MTFLPSDPAVKAAGYAKASNNRYGFWAEVGKRCSPIFQSLTTAFSMGTSACGRLTPGRYLFGLPEKVTLAGGPDSKV